MYMLVRKGWCPWCMSGNEELWTVDLKQVERWYNRLFLVCVEEDGYIYPWDALSLLFWVANYDMTAKGNCRMITRE